MLEKSDIELKNKKNEQIAIQVLKLSDFFYNELKKIQKGEYSINHLKSIFFQSIKDNNLFFKNNDFFKLENALNKTIQEFHMGEFYNTHLFVGILNAHYSGFLLALEKRFKAISLQSMFTGYYALEVSSSTFMESDYTEIVLASKNKQLLTSLAKKIETIDHNTTTNVFFVRGTSLNMFHKSYSDWNYSHVSESNLGDDDSLLEILVKQAEKEYSDESANIYIKEVKFVESLTKQEESSILKQINPYMDNPLEYIIAVKRKQKAKKTGKYFIKGFSEKFDVYKGMSIVLKDEKKDVFY